jgi:DNA-binding CsgD family transcriptional regulator
MNVFGTQMHVVTFIFSAAGLLFMLPYQLIHYLSRPEDKTRYWYLILLILLIIYDITGGLFPDPKIPIPIIAQNIMAYGSGFVMASFFPYYFYKGMELHDLRFHAIYGVPVFLLLPYAVFFIGAYSINGDLNFAIRYGIIIPFFYSLILAYAIVRAVRAKYKEDKNNWMLVATCCAVIPSVSLSVVSYFNLSQAVEVFCTNMGFVVLSILLASDAIKKSKQEHLQHQIEHQQLLELKLNGVKPCRFKENIDKYGLSKREVEIIQLFRQGYTKKEIGETLHIAEGTVNKHVSNIYLKVDVSNQRELIKKLEE